MIDIDSFIGEVCGYQKQGAGYGYTKKLGYHPLLATRAGSSEVLHIRNRKGQANTQRGQQRFLDELLARVRRAGATGTILIRADTGFENKKVFARLDGQGVEFSIGVKLHRHVRDAIEQIPEDAWNALADYPDTGEAQIAETTRGRWRLIVRRVRTRAEQPQPFATWQHFAFATNRTEPLETVEAEHREHAVVKLAIRDLKDQALAHFPSGNYHANSAWCVIAALAHNLGRWTTMIGLPDELPRTARTRRRRLFEIPGRLTRSARQETLHMPARWPWRADFDQALARIRAHPRAPRRGLTPRRSHPTTRPPPRPPPANSARPKAPPQTRSHAPEAPPGPRQTPREDLTPADNTPDTPISPSEHPTRWIQVERYSRRRLLASGRSGSAVGAPACRSGGSESQSGAGRHHRCAAGAHGGDDLLGVDAWR